MRREQARKSLSLARIESQRRKPGDLARQSPNLFL